MSDDPELSEQSGAVQVQVQRNRFLKFKFDKVFDQKSRQEDLFNELEMRYLVKRVMLGKDCLVCTAG